MDKIKPFQKAWANNGLKINGGYRRCYHCRCCGSGCPFIGAFDHPPNAIIRMLQLGLIDEALSSSTIWTCVACNTCSMECPMAIDIPAVMDDLRHLAIKRGIPPAEPDVAAFHQSVLDSIGRHGRTHKLEIMMHYKLKTRTWLQDWQKGLAMLAKRKLDLTPSRIENLKALQALMARPDEE